MDLPGESVVDTNSSIYEFEDDDDDDDEYKPEAGEVSEGMINDAGSVSEALNEVDDSAKVDGKPPKKATAVRHTTLLFFP